MDYKSKYLKYKSKYISQRGGNIVIFNGKNYVIKTINEDSVKHALNEESIKLIYLTFSSNQKIIEKTTEKERIDFIFFCEHDLIIPKPIGLNDETILTTMYGQDNTSTAWKRHIADYSKLNQNDIDAFNRQLSYLQLSNDYPNLKLK